MAVIRYSDKTLRYFYNTTHAGSMNAAKGVYVGESGTDANGDRLRIYLKVNNSQIDQVRFQVNGTVASIACSQFIAEYLEGKLLSDLSTIDAKMILNELELPNIKIHSVMLVIRALNNIVNKGDK